MFQGLNTRILPSKKVTLYTPAECVKIALAMVVHFFRYGRITVSTLESKLASAEKDVTRLTKALERSDKYIEELETELDDYRGKSGSSKRQSSASDRDDKHLTNGDIANRKYSSDSKVPPSKEYGIGADNPSRRQLFSDDTGARASSGEKSKYYYERNGDIDDYRNEGRSQNAKANGDNGGKKRVTFDLNKNTNSATSFELELPSPLKNSANASGLANGRASPVKGVLKKPISASNRTSSSDRSNDKSGYSTDLSKDSLSDSYNVKSADRYSKDDDLLFLKNKSRSSRDKDDEDDFYSKPRRKYSADDSVLSEPSDIDLKRSREKNYSSRSRGSEYERGKRSDPLDDLDIEIRRSRDRLDDIDKNDLDDTQYIESELDELNISVTPEFTDCMKILNRAEKNVHTHVSDNGGNDLPKYRSAETDMDTAFRASTGSIGQRSSTEDLLSKYKTDTSRFTSSLDSYSRGRHVRTGSLDNIYIDSTTDQYERPSSALPSASNMYPPNSQNKYMGGLTTGRTTLTRTPSLDNLLLARQSTGYQNKYSSVEDTLGLKSRMDYPGYIGRRQYGEEENKLDVNSGSGTMPGSAPVAARHDILGSQGSGSSVGERYGNLGSDGRSGVDTVTDSISRGYSSDKVSAVSTSTKDFDIGRKLPPSGRQTPTLPVSSTGNDMDKIYTTGRITPTIPTHSEYMALSKPSTDKYSYSANTNSGRSTPTLTSNTDYTSLTKPTGQYSDLTSSGPSSLPSDLSQKPPTGSRSMDIASMRGINTGSYSNQPSSYNSSSSAYTNSGEGYHSLPSYTGSNTNSNTGVGSGYGERFENRTSIPSMAPLDMNKFTSSLDTRSSDYPGDKLEYGASSNYRSDDKYMTGSKSVPSYNDNNYKDGTDFSNFSTKIAVNNSNNTSNIPFSVSSLTSQANLLSASSAGSSSSSLGFPSYPGPSSSYLPTSLTSLTSTSSYSTAHSVPLTFTTSTYTSSVPANTYTSKALDPIAESGHYSYVSNVSGDYSSKNDTFALPEPKKRLFENSDDLNMSVSPIKSNRRF